MAAAKIKPAIDSSALQNSLVELQKLHLEELDVAPGLGLSSVLGITANDFLSDSDTGWIPRSETRRGLKAPARIPLHHKRDPGAG